MLEYKGDGGEIIKYIHELIQVLQTHDHDDRMISSYNIHIYIILMRAWMRGDGIVIRKRRKKKKRRGGGCPQREENVEVDVGQAEGWGGEATPTKPLPCN